MTRASGCLFLFAFIAILGVCFNSKSSYIAAVVDYKHVYANFVHELLSANVEEYLQLMRNASREYADIIVFPEYGLVDIYTMYAIVDLNTSRLDMCSTFVPHPDLEVVPCEDKRLENYSMHLVSISCAARIHGLYTVINLVEKDYNNETQKVEFFNTNVVFDRLGTVIARYRKIHLSEEPFLQPGNELVTFETDFGVTFGIITCFDLLFQYPALEVLTLPNVTDIIFPTSWFSETPFLQALSIQHGYAKANGVNMLVAGYQDPTKLDGGSGIFLADGTIAESFISASDQTAIIIQEVPIIEERLIPNTCTNADHSQNRPKKSAVTTQLNIDNFNITREDLTGYTFEQLAKGPRTLTRICSNEKEICCIFNVTIDSTNEERPDYTYMMAVYHGVSKYGSNIMGGIRTCALLACLNESDTGTCGYKLDTSLNSVKFKSIQITAVVEKTNYTYEQPSTLRHDLQPMFEYTYCSTSINNDTQTKIIMATTAPQELVLTFGVYGRVYTNDVIIVPPPPPEIKPLNYTLIIMIVSFSVVMMICTAGLLYKFCMKDEK